MQGEGRHWLITERKNLKGELIETDGAGDVRVRLKVSSQARKKNPTIPEYWEVRKVSYAVRGGIMKTVLTSLPADQYNSKDIAMLSQECREIELSFRNIKSSMQHNAIMLRIKTVELVYQELWGLLLTYNSIRREARVCSGSIWAFTFGYPFQACMPTHSRSVDCDGECQPFVGDW